MTYNIEEWNIGDIKPNKDNPRVIKNEAFKKLVKSIKEFPEMMNIRPIVVDDNGVILGGNKRFKACREAGRTKIPVIKAKDLTEEQKKEFIIKDNVQSGEWDYDILANEWDDQDLLAWGAPIPDVSGTEDEEDVKNRFNKMGEGVYPVVPEPDEDHELFVIVCESEMDANWLRERLNMQKMQSYKSSEISKSNIIHVNDLKDVL